MSVAYVSPQTSALRPELHERPFVSTNALDEAQLQTSELLNLTISRALNSFHSNIQTRGLYSSHLVYEPLEIKPDITFQTKYIFKDCTG